jgi:hypothetical protein
MNRGIYTLANDLVYDQVVALLNSIEANTGSDMPVCIIAYNNQLERLRAEIAHRPNVTLMDDPTIFERWETFSQAVWQTHPTALDTWKEAGYSSVYRIECNHRYAAFDAAAPFEKFIYLDADTLVLDSLDPVFDELEKQDFVTYDFQHRHPAHIFNLSPAKLLEIFPQERINTEIFCSGFFASKRGLFNQEQRAWIVDRLAEGEAEILYLRAPNQSVLNYMTMRSGVIPYNLALKWPQSQVAGNSVTCPDFVIQDGTAYHNGNRLTYMHYIGLPSSLFKHICAGENWECPYRELFLHYRYLHQPEARPQFTGKPKVPRTTPTIAKRLANRWKMITSAIRPHNQSYSVR